MVISTNGEKVGFILMVTSRYYLLTLYVNVDDILL